MFDKVHSLFTEIYRPKTIKEYLGNEDFISKLEDWIENNDIPHMLLSGPAGIGKTTAAKLIVNNLDCDWIFINASDERGIDTLREKVIGFASSATFAPIKIVILDEADYLSHLSQPALRGIIEQYSASTRFILTCNYSDKIIPALKSRCTEFQLKPPSKKAIALRIDQILTKENIDYDPADIKTIINKNYPDIRAILNHVQINCKENKLVLSVQEVNSNKLNQLLIDSIKTKTKDTTFRQLIIDQNSNDFTGTYRFLFDSLDEWCEEKHQPEALITLNQYLYQSYFVPDKELNISACIANLKEIINN